MSVISPPRPPIPDETSELEALIREARDRQRRRRRRIGLAVAAAAAVGAVLGVVFSGGSGNPAVVRIPNGPTVNVEAFAGQGRLAFVSRNSLWVVDGTSRSLRKVKISVGLRP